jgi:solute carrier family 24 (sodium/potassium/calcium exchanger), member 6
MFDSPTTPFAGGHYHAHPKSRPRTPHRLSQEYDPWEHAVALPLNDRSPQVLLTSITDDPLPASDEAEEGTAIPTIAHTPSSPTVSDGDTESQQFPPLTRHQLVLYAVGEVFHTLVPSLHHFKSATILGKIAAVFAAPAVTALTLTLPVVVTPYETIRSAEEKFTPDNGEARLIDFEEEGVERALVAEDELQKDMHDLRFNKWLMAAQCVFGPLFCVGVLFSGFD